MPCKGIHLIWIFPIEDLTRQLVLNNCASMERCAFLFYVDVSGFNKYQSELISNRAPMPHVKIKSQVDLSIPLTVVIQLLIKYMTHTAGKALIKPKIQNYSTN